MSAFDYEVTQEENSTSNPEFTRAFRCSSTQNVRCASNLETLTFKNN